MRTNLATWLWCMWKVQRVYRKRGLLFSQRMKFLEELRPFVNASEQARIAYPDAIFWITPADVKRAALSVTERSTKVVDRLTEAP